MNRYGEVFAKFYDHHFADYSEKLAPVLLRFFSSQTIAKKYSQVLDLGCGTGRLALRFLDAGYSFLGLDCSPHMLMMAETRCWHYVSLRRGRFLEDDISRFKIGGPFGMVMSTYNSINHLVSEDQLKGCFKSVRGSLVEGGKFIFDFHTIKGLKEWGRTESMESEGETVESLGFFDEVTDRAVMHLKGTFGYKPFEETILNQGFSLTKISQWLRQEGFKRIDFVQIENFHKTLENPEMEKRVMICAG